jgi:hypothetical protein
MLPPINTSGIGSARLLPVVESRLQGVFPGQSARAAVGQATRPRVTLENSQNHACLSSQHALFDDRLEAADVGFDAEVRLERLTLGMEDVHPVATAWGDAECRGLGVEIDGALKRLV